MKIGDEILVHGFIDEIRKDTVIVRNDGGYFGTSETEIERINDKDEFIFDADEYCLIVDKGKIHVLRRGSTKIAVEIVWSRVLERERRDD